MNDWTWNVVKNSDMDSSFVLHSSMAGAKPYIKSMVERIQAIENHEEAVEVIFNISQKVTHYYFSNHYMMAEKELGRRLHISLSKLLKQRIQKIKEGEKHEKK